MRNVIIVLFIVSLSVSSSIYSEEDKNINITTLQASANSGNVEAQFDLGYAYDSGQDVRSNGRKAKKWYTKAAKQGHAEAQNSLGSGYQAANKYKKDLYWYEQSASQNHRLALNNLAYLYDLEIGV